MGLIALFALSLILRLIGANQSFWLDEGTSLVFARLPLANLLSVIQNDFHPPLSYLLLHFWLPLAGRAEWLIRLPGIIFGALTVPALYLLLKNILGEKKKSVARLAALLLAVNPLHVYYSAELRMYSLNALLSVISWFFLVKAVKVKNNKNTFYLGYALASAANLYTFYGALFNLFSQWIYVFWQERKNLKAFLVINLLIFILFLPWLPTLGKQLAGGGYLTRTLPGWSALSGNLSPKSLGLIMAKFTIGRVSLANKTAYALFTAGISLYFFFCCLLAYRKKENRLLLIWFFVSLASAILVSFKTPVLGYWRFIFLIPAFVSLLTAGLSALPADSRNFNLLLVALIFLLGNLIFWATPSIQREDWRAAAKLISVDRSLAIVNFPDVFAPLKFYAPDVFYYPAQESLGRPRTDLDQTLPLVLKNKKRVFIFDYLSDLTDRKRSILVWLKRAGLIQESTHNIPGVGFIYEFKTP